MVRGTSLKILGLVSSDAGIYQCIASNQAGTIQASAQLQVKSKGIILSTNEKRTIAALLQCYILPTKCLSVVLITRKGIEMHAFNRIFK